MEEREILQERLELALLRIREIPGEDFQGAELLPWKEYFTTVAKFLLLIEDTRQFLEQGETGHCHIGRITAAQPCSV